MSIAGENARTKQKKVSKLSDGLLTVYIISVPSSFFRGLRLPDLPAFLTKSNTTHSDFAIAYTFSYFITSLKLFTMSSTYDHNDFEANESFETLRILDHDDLEDNRPVAGPMTEFDSTVSNLRNSWGGVHEMPVGLIP